MRDRSCNLRWGHLEIWDGGINSIEKKERVLQKGLEGRVGEVCVKMNCYSTHFNRSVCECALMKNVGAKRGHI